MKLFQEFELTTYLGTPLPGMCDSSMHAKKVTQQEKHTTTFQFITEVLTIVVAIALEDAVYTLAIVALPFCGTALQWLVLSCG